MVPIGLDERDILIAEVRIVQALLLGRIRRASFDRAFHSPENQIALAEIILHPCLPKPGLLQAAEQAVAATAEFKQSRRQHSGIESAIGALQSGNGLARCRDHTQAGYTRYIGLGVLGRNVLLLGKLLLAVEHPYCAAAVSLRGQAAIKSCRPAARDSAFSLQRSTLRQGNQIRPPRWCQSGQIHSSLPTRAEPPAKTPPMAAKSTISRQTLGRDFRRCFRVAVADPSLFCTEISQRASRPLYLALDKEACGSLNRARVRFSPECLTNAKRKSATMEPRQWIHSASSAYLAPPPLPAILERFL